MPDFFQNFQSKTFNLTKRRTIYIYHLELSQKYIYISYGSNTSGGGGSGLIKEHSDPSGKVATV